MMKKTWTLLSLLLLSGLTLAACQNPAETPTATPDITAAVTAAPTPTPEPTPVPVTRRGGWLDSITFVAADAADAVSQVAAGALDGYFGLLSDSAQFGTADAAGLTTQAVCDRFYEIALNPAPIDDESKGKLNPLSDAGIREALNRLIDRETIVSEDLGGGGWPKYTPLTATLADAGRYADALDGIAQRLSYDPDACEAVVSERMRDMGAELTDGLWTYGEKPVTLTFLIRNDDPVATRIGDRFADGLEGLGFTVEREYMTADEAAEIWLGGDPAEGGWHLYAGCWRVNENGRDAAGSRDSGSDFIFYGSADSIMSYYPLWRLFTVPDETAEVYDALARKQYHTADERGALFTQALDETPSLSYRLYVADASSAACWSGDLLASADTAAGLAVGEESPYLLRLRDTEGGGVTLGVPALLDGAVNPLYETAGAGTVAAMRFTQDHGLVTDAETGIATAQRVQSAQLTVRGDLPVEKAADSPWLTVEKAGDSIPVPGDALIAWDGENETWLTVDEQYPGGLSALVRSVVTYEDDLGEVRWHDGSGLTAADFMMAMIVRFDRAYPGSALYDAQAAEDMEAFQGLFRGFRIVSADPLTIEYYTDAYAVDAESCVEALWPQLDGGQAPWHLLAVCNRSEATGETAYSAAKATEAKGETINLLAGPSLELLKTACEEALSESYIPYASVMGDYVTAGEAAARYQNLLDFYAAHGHMALGTGPYMLDSVDSEKGTLTLVSNADYADLCNRRTEETP